MGTIRIMFYAYVGLLAVFTVNPIQADMEQERAMQLTTSINRFASDFYGKVADEKLGENLIMSPLSAQTVLALLTMGAKAETLDEINRSLYLPDIEFTKQAFKPAMAKLNELKGITLNIANKVYVKDGPAFDLSPEFKSLAVEVFQSEIENIDFSQSQAAATDINTWVEKRTNDKIKDLISPDSLDGMTRLVLINAIYFKGDWEKKFDKERTNKQDFHLDNTRKIQVDMMHQTAKFLYADIPEWNAKMIELPYVGREASMVIVLPNEIEGLKELEEKMAASNFNEYLQRLHQVEVVLSLPKFKIETSMDLKTVLQKLGMKKMFSPGEANLSGLLKNNEQLYVSDAIQKAFIEVNEEGAEAAAATGMILMCRMLPITMEFNADRPFIYAILANRDKIFSGKLINPTLESK